METNLEELEEQNILRKLVLSIKMKKRLFAVALASVLVLVCGIFGWSNALLRKTIDEQNQKIDDLMEQPVVVNPVAPEISLSVIYEEIQNIGELATVEYLFTDAAIFSDSQQIGNWNIPFTEKSFTMKWDGIIKAGIQVDKIAIDVNKDDLIITVTLPAAEILSYEVDSDSVEVLDEKNNIFNEISVNDKVQLDAATEKEMKDRVIRNGLLEKAQKNAEDIISRLLTANNAIGHNYTIIFQIAE